MQDQDASAAREPLRSSPVDDVTYDLLQALTSKLEAIEAYQMYAGDGEEAAELFIRLAADEKAHAAELLDALRQRLGD
jgi:rubrerythrin